MFWGRWLVSHGSRKIKTLSSVLSLKPIVLGLPSSRGRNLFASSLRRTNPRQRPSISLRHQGRLPLTPRLGREKRPSPFFRAHCGGAFP